MANIFRTASESISTSDAAHAIVGRGQGVALNATVWVTTWVEFYGGPLDGDMTELSYNPVEGYRPPGYTGVYRPQGPAFDDLPVVRMRWTYRK
jgi:hypothetical protein